MQLSRFLIPISFRKVVVHLSEVLKKKMTTKMQIEVISINQLKFQLKFQISVKQLA